MDELPPDDLFNKPGPFDKDTLEKAPQPLNIPTEQLSTQAPLQEKDFIHEPPAGIVRSLPLWTWFALFIVMLSILWGVLGWYNRTFAKELESKSFLEVKNRDFSLFLWQFPSYMRSNLKKTAYLTGFLQENVTLDLAKTEEYVLAPPDLLFLYHTWNRLLSNDLIARPVPIDEFKEFLSQVPEWKPENWRNSPANYKQLIGNLNGEKSQDLASVLPKVVVQAFVGWKNYFKEGAKINALKPTYKQINEFLKKYPHYARNYWQNIQSIEGQEVAGPVYLVSLENKESDEVIPAEQVAPFLKVALYNYVMGTKA